MITYINNENTTEYTALFDKATKYLGLDQLDEPTSITTLEEYFKQLPNLLGVEDINASTYDILHSEGRRYTMLPLDEEVFLIDADSRSVTVPDSFKKNGIAVQGDELAEVVYFEIDRFYDSTDLDTCEIYIQWEAADGITKGVSVPWVVDIYSKPNKIIFGWALSHEVTEKHGTIKFAVRFYKWANPERDQLAYSLSTLTTTANIKPALDFPLEIGEGFHQEFATDDLIVHRITTSDTKLTGGEKAQKAVFILDLPTSIDLDPSLNFKLPDETTEPGAAELKVYARSVDGGLISYQWYKLGEGDSRSGIPAYNWGVRYDKTEDTVEEIQADIDANTVKVYYLKSVEGEVEKYTPTNVKNLIGDISFTTTYLPNLYERVSYCFVGNTGEYVAVAKNSKGIDHIDKDSVICVVPGPSHPEIITNLEKSYILTKTENAEGEEEVSKVTLSVEAEADGEKSYVWFRTTGKTPEVEVTEEIVGATTASLEVDEIGKYKVKITNTRNKDQDSEVSEVAKVTFTAPEPTLVYPVNAMMLSLYDITNDKNDAGDAMRVEVKPEIVNDQYASENITYQWFLVNEDAYDENDTAIDQSVGGNSRFYVPQSPGRYYCRVTNNLNGTTATIDSQIFGITP